MRPVTPEPRQELGGGRRTLSCVVPVPPWANTHSSPLRHTVEPSTPRGPTVPPSPTLTCSSTGLSLGVDHVPGPVEDKIVSRPEQVGLLVVTLSEEKRRLGRSISTLSGATESLGSDPDRMRTTVFHRV